MFVKAESFQSMRLEGLTGLERHEGRLFLAGPWAAFLLLSQCSGQPPFPLKLVLCALPSLHSLSSEPRPALLQRLRSLGLSQPSLFNS